MVGLVEYDDHDELDDPMTPSTRRWLVFTLAASLILVAMLVSAQRVRAATNTGQHIHTEVTNHPVDGFPVPAKPYTFHVIIRAHNQTAPIRWLRVDNESTSGPQFKFPGAPLGPCADCSVAFDYTIDFSKWSQGRHELRWHADAYPNSDGNRQFTTSRSQVCIVTCDNKSGRTTPFNGGGSWYLGQYATAYVLSRDSDIRPGGSIKVRAAQDAKSICVLQNPDIHHGSSGTHLGCWSDTSNHTISLSSVAVGDRLLVLAMQPNGNAGLIRLIVGDGTPQPFADYEYQSWWAKGGVVLP